MKVEGLDHVALATTDLERSVQWYADVLGLERRHEHAWGDIPAVMCSGDTCVAFFAFGEAPGAAGPPGMLHLAFRVDRAGFTEAQALLLDRGIAFEFQDHDIAYSIYFDDPDGHALEITTYDLD